MAAVWRSGVYGRFSRFLPDWNECERLLISAALVPGLFFTFSSNVLWTYLFPAMPPLALALALALTKNPEPEGRRAYLNRGLMLFVPGILTLAGGYVSIQHTELNTEKYLVEAYQSAIKTDDGRLQYIGGEVPLSARYYSNDQAERVGINEAFKLIDASTPVSSYLVLKHKLLPLFQNRSKATCETLARSKQNTLIHCFNKTNTEKSLAHFSPTTLF